MPPIICRTLAGPVPTLTALSDELDRTSRAVADRLPENPSVRFDKVGDKLELVLGSLDEMDEPASLIRCCGMRACGIEQISNAAQ